MTQNYLLRGEVLDQPVDGLLHREPLLIGTFISEDATEGINAEGEMAINCKCSSRSRILYPR